MRNVAIEKIIKILEEKEVNLSKMVALDLFAREGDWQTSYYASKVSHVHAWEIDPKFESNLRKNLPSNSDIIIGDSFEILKRNSQKFDMIVIDNPQGCFGEDQSLCEHFDALPAVLNHFTDYCIIIFNVKTTPYNYEDKIEWQKRRNNFYGINSKNLDKDFIFNFYKNYFESRGFEVIFQLWEARPQENNLYSFVSSLRRKKLCPV